MTKTKTAKRALFSSVIALMLCFTMLLGTTYAWFTDSVASAGNIIKSGTLDVEMWHADGKTDPDSATWTDASTGAIFNYDLWEPGYVDVRHIQIKNVGTLALKYKVQIVANGVVSDLADVIDVYYLDPAAQIADRTALDGITPMGTLTDALAGMASTASGNLKAGESDTITIALKMRESAGNEYQNKSIGTDFSIQLLATQWTFEEDSFDNTYDEQSAEGPDNVGWPFEIASASATVASGEATVLRANAAPSSDDKDTKVTFEADALTASDTVKLNVTTSDTETASSTAYSVLSGGTTAAGAIDLTLYVNGSASATTSNFGNVVIETYIAKNLSTVKIQYNGDSSATFGSATNATVVSTDTAATTLGTATYNPETGYLSFVTDHFSEYVIQSGSVAYSSTTDTAYGTVQAAVNATDAGGTVILLNDYSATAIVEVTKDLTINGAGHSISTSANRGIWIAADDVDLTLKDLTIDGNNICERGVQVNTGAEDNFYNANITMDGCTIKNFTHYAINFCSNTTVDITINNSYISGWAAINAYGFGNKITVNNSTLIGTNDKTKGGSNNFCTICLEGDTTGQTTDHSEAYIINISNSTISASQTTGNVQCVLGFNNGAINSDVNFTNCNFIIGEGCYFGFDISQENTTNTLSVNGEDIELVYGYYFNLQ